MWELNPEAQMALNISKKQIRMKEDADEEGRGGKRLQIEGNEKDKGNRNTGRQGEEVRR